MSGPTDMLPVDMLLWGLLGYVVFPLWLLSGTADYLCHARTDIAHTSGTYESALHLLQTAEIGLPVLVFLFLSTNALTLALMTAGEFERAVRNAGTRCKVCRRTRSFNRISRPSRRAGERAETRAQNSAQV